MNNLREIDDRFVDEYIFNHRNNLTKPTIGGTDWRFVDIVAPAFREVLEISKPERILEIGFNIGGSALLFLSINPELVYDSVDISMSEKSVDWLSKKFRGFNFTQLNSSDLIPNTEYFLGRYHLVFIDGDHGYDAVVSDIETAIKFKPQYILLDDYKHPSHAYIETIVTEKYKDKLEVVKVYELNQCWNGYSMGLCKVKYDAA